LLNHVTALVLLRVARRTLREVARVVLHLDPEHDSDRAGGRLTAIYRVPNG